MKIVTTTLAWGVFFLRIVGAEESTVNLEKHKKIAIGFKKIEIQSAKLQETKEANFSQFELGVTEVSREQWRLVFADSKKYFGKDQFCPATWITQIEARRFAELLTKKHRKLGLIQENQIYSLPTASQWEAVAQKVNGEIVGEPNLGAPLDPEPGLYRIRSSEVASGIFDMFGNASEFTISLPERIEGNDRIASQLKLLCLVKGNSFSRRSHGKYGHLDKYVVRIDTRYPDVGFRLVRLTFEMAQLPDDLQKSLQPR